MTATKTKPRQNRGLQQRLKLQQKNYNQYKDNKLDRFKNKKIFIFTFYINLFILTSLYLPLCIESLYPWIITWP